jgi:hypothetical protein
MWAADMGRERTKARGFSAADFEPIPVERCETSKICMKTIDPTENGLAEPQVDELAAAPLDLLGRA